MRVLIGALCGAVLSFILCWPNRASAETGAPPSVLDTCWQCAAISQIPDDEWQAFIAAVMDANNRDSDGDGRPDRLEGLDTDGDGYSDEEEEALGWDPNVPLGQEPTYDPNEPLPDPGPPPAP